MEKDLIFCHYLAYECIIVRCYNLKLQQISFTYKAADTSSKIIRQTKIVTSGIIYYSCMSFISFQY